jgi:uncharacterized protein
MTTKRCRILALDGGGIKGAFTAAALAELERSTNLRVIDHFDLIVGTSTGGLLAIGLGLGIPAQRMLDLYIQSGTDIFSGTRVVDRTLFRIAHVFRPKHSHERLRAVLTGVFGDRKLGESSVRLVIPTFDALKGTACTFKTAHHPQLRHEFDMLAVDAAIATASAPTYFPATEVQGREGNLYLDGGVWANCPILVGIVEAIHFMGFDLSDLYLLSIGTTAELSCFVSKRRSGILGWNLSLLEVMMAGQVTSAESQGRLLLGNRLHRINVPTPNDVYKLDDGSRRTAWQLAALGQSICRNSENLGIVRERFLDGIHVLPFRPVYQAQHSPRTSEGSSIND